MSISTVQCNGAIVTNNCMVAHARAWQTRSVVGSTGVVSTVANDVPAYGPPRLVPGSHLAAGATPPGVVTVDSTAASRISVEACGLRPDGVTRSYVVDRLVGATRRVARYWGVTIADGVFTSPALAGQGDTIANIVCDAVSSAVNPAGRKLGRSDMLRGAGTANGEDPDRVFDPVAYIDMFGVTYVACAVAVWTGSAWQTRGSAIVAWPHEGTPRLHALFGEVQAGQSRGAPFATHVWWVASDPKALYVTTADYRTNPGSRGGEVYLTRVAAIDPANPQSAWQLGQSVMLLRATLPPGAHIHGAAVTTKADGTGLVVLAFLGDGPSARTIMLQRDDLNYAQGFADHTTPTTTQPDLHTVTAWTGNGWRTEWTASGDPYVAANGIEATNCTWTAGANTLANGAFGTDPMVGWHVRVNSGTGTTPNQIVSVTGHTGTTLTLSDSIAASNATNVAVTVYRPRPCVQPVGLAPLADGSVIVGSDEGVPFTLRPVLPDLASPTERKIRWDSAGSSTGTTPAAASLGVATMSMTTHEKWWLNFYMHPNGPAGEQVVRAHPGPLIAAGYSSALSGDGWNTDTTANRLYVSDASGRCWSAVAVPGIQAHSTNNRFVTDGQFAFVCSGATARAIRLSASRRVQAPLLAASPTVTQHMRTATVADRTLGGLTPAGQYTVVPQGDLATLVPGWPIPRPLLAADNAEVGRIITDRAPGNDWYASRELGDVPLDQDCLVTFLVYVMPGSLATARSQRVALNVRFFNATAGTWLSALGSVELSADGSGWVPVTCKVSAPGGTGTYSLGASVRGQGFGNAWQPLDVLICWASVLTGGGVGSGSYGNSPPPMAVPCVVSGSTSLAGASTTTTLPASVGLSFTLVARLRVPDLGNDRWNTGTTPMQVRMPGAAQALTVSLRPWLGTGQLRLAGATTVDRDTPSVPARGGTIMLAIAQDNAANQMRTVIACDGGALVEQAGGSPLTAGVGLGACTQVVVDGASAELLSLEVDRARAWTLAELRQAVQTPWMSPTAQAALNAGASRPGPVGVGVGL